MQGSQKKLIMTLVSGSIDHLFKPRESISLNQLNAKPAVFNLKLNNKGLKAFNVHGIDYSYDVIDKYVYHGAEGGDAKSSGEAEAQPIPEATEEPRRKNSNTSRCCHWCINRYIGSGSVGKHAIRNYFYLGR